MPVATPLPDQWAVSANENITAMLNLKTELYALAMKDQNVSPYVREQILQALHRAGLLNMPKGKIDELVARHPNFQSNVQSEPFDQHIAASELENCSDCGSWRADEMCVRHSYKYCIDRNCNHTFEGGFANLTGLHARQEDCP